VATPSLSGTRDIILRAANWVRFAKNRLWTFYTKIPSIYVNITGVFVRPEKLTARKINDLTFKFDRLQGGIDSPERNGFVSHYLVIPRSVTAVFDAAQAQWRAAKSQMTDFRIEKARPSFVQL
jgi:hypothetical protein